MPPSTAGTGFAAATALSRGMQDMSMGDPSLGETQNFCAHAALKVAMRLWCPCSMLTVGACGALADEFKENNEQQDSLNDIDDFERRLEGGAARKAPAPAAKAAGKPAAARQALPVAGKMKGADYVDAAKRAGAGSKKQNSGDDDGDDADDDAKRLMDDLSKFEQQHGVDDDDD